MLLGKNLGEKARPGLCILAHIRAYLRATYEPWVYPPAVSVGFIPQALPASWWTPPGPLVQSRFRGSRGCFLHLMTVGGPGKCGWDWYLIGGWLQGTWCCGYELELCAVHGELGVRGTVHGPFRVLVGRRFLLWKEVSWRGLPHLRYLEQVPHLSVPHSISLWLAIWAGRSSTI